MSDYDPRDWGYEPVKHLPKGYYVRETYMKEAGSMVWQPMQTQVPAFAAPEPFRQRSEAEAWCRGFKDALELIKMEGEI